MNGIVTQGIEPPFTIEQVAELTNKSIWVVRSYIRKGMLKRIGGKRSGMISASSLRAFLNGINSVGEH